MEGLVYRVTNKVENKSYIGITGLSLKERWERHLSCSKNVKNTNPFYGSIRKYGQESWSLERMERFWKGRKKYKMTQGHRKAIVNVSLGKVRIEDFKRNVSEKLKNRKLSKEHKKKGQANRKAVVCVETRLVYDNIEAAAQNLKVSVPSIRKVLGGKIKSIKGYSFGYAKKETINEQS